MTAVKGDEVTIIVKGEVASDGSVYDACHKVKDRSGRYHYFYLPSADSSGSGVTVTVTKKAEHFTTGEAYKDADGDVFIRTASGWVDEYGTSRGDAYPSRPLTLLEAVTHVTEDGLKAELRRVFRTSGDYADRIGTSAVPYLVAAAKRAGVKVAK